jgi:hypothetical protein
MRDSQGDCATVAERTEMPHVTFITPHAIELENARGPFSIDLVSTPDHPFRPGAMRGLPLAAAVAAPFWVAIYLLIR